MATQYNYFDQPFTAKLDMLNYEFSTSIKPSENALHMIECDPRQTSVDVLYTNYNQPLANNADPRLYYLGLFNIATTGFQGTNVNVGELHVTYQVRLLKPKMWTSLGNTNDIWEIQYGSNTGQANQFNAANPLGILATAVPTLQHTNGSPAGGSGFGAIGTIMTFPNYAAQLCYYIHIMWHGSTPGTAVYPNVTFQNAAPSSTGVSVIDSGESINDMTLSTFMTTTGVGIPSMTLATNGTFATGNQWLLIKIIQVPAQFQNTL